MSVTADLVKQLRERTNVGMMECKRALVETNGNIEAAIEVLRKSGQLKAAKKEGTITAEGLVMVLTSADLKQAIMLEINSQTDFVARDVNFTQFAERVLHVALTHRCKDVATLAQVEIDAGKTVEQARQELIAKIGENITLRRLVYLESSHPIGAYNHGGRIAALVVMKSGAESVARDIAMHVAASNPQVVNPEQVDQALVAKEREIYTAQAATSGKPADIVAKMVDGKIKKFLEEISLTCQAFVKNPDLTVAAYLKQNQADVESFQRFAVGEGIEKPVTDFAEEVMSQVRGA